MGQKRKYNEKGKAGGDRRKEEEQAFCLAGTVDGSLVDGTYGQQPVSLQLGFLEKRWRATLMPDKDF